MSGVKAIVSDHTVPSLWENCGEWVPTIKADGESGSEYMDVYACWKSDRPKDVPHVYISMRCGSMGIGADFLPAHARALAASLIKGAELAEATALALAQKEAAEEFAQLSRAPEA